MSVLWATHLTDEVEPDDSVVVLHKGKLRAIGLMAALLGKAGAADMKGAFVALIGENETRGAE